MNPWVLLVIIVALAGSHFASYRHGVTTTEGAYALAQQEGAKQREEALTAVAKELAKIEVKNTTIRQTLEKEIHENVIYMDCNHDDRRMQLINAALTNKPIPVGDSKLPGTNPVAR